MTFLMTMPILLYGMDMAAPSSKKKARASSRSCSPSPVLKISSPANSLASAPSASRKSPSGSPPRLFSRAQPCSGPCSVATSNPLQHSSGGPLPHLLHPRLLPLQRLLLRPCRHLRNRAGSPDVHHPRRHSHLDQLCHPALPSQQSQLTLGRRCLHLSSHRATRHGPAHRHDVRPLSLVAARHLARTHGPQHLGRHLVRLPLYRVGILMYGKRATLPELLRWLRYS